MPTKDRRYLIGQALYAVYVPRYGEWNGRKTGQVEEFSVSHETEKFVHVLTSNKKTVIRLEKGPGGPYTNQSDFRFFSDAPLLALAKRRNDVKERVQNLHRELQNAQAELESAQAFLDNATKEQADG